MNTTFLFLFRTSITSESEMTADLSDRYCTGDELENDYSHIPKVVSQSTGIGEIKRSESTNNNNNDMIVSKS